MFLAFLLQRHPTFARLVEFGTFTGVTAIELAVAAALRPDGQGRLDTFDIEDLRLPHVARLMQTLDAYVGYHISDLDTNPMLPAHRDPEATGTGTQCAGWDIALSEHLVLPFVWCDVSFTFLACGQATRCAAAADMLFIDGGNKALEVWLYAPLLRVGAGLLVHVRLWCSPTRRQTGASERQWCWCVARHTTS